MHCIDAVGVTNSQDEEVSQVPLLVFVSVSVFVFVFVFVSVFLSVFVFCILQCRPVTDHQSW